MMTMKMMDKDFYDVAVIGAGAAGLAAAAETSAAGFNTLVIDRQDRAGGILRQCIHNGFGLHCFKEELTGPEYAERAAEKAIAAGAEFALCSTVTDLKKLENGTFELILRSRKYGTKTITAKTVILAMGCRERNRGNLGIPGTRPAGVFTAGAAQKLLNCEGFLPGTSAVIVGSGDIGLIMARRLQWCGIKVKAVVEIMPHPSGLTRNIVQCLHDFNIPLYLSHSVTRICGKDRVEGVDVAPLSDPEKSFHIDCDTVLFSTGLIPEMELGKMIGVEIDPSTGGAKVNANYETSVPGVFSAGNVLHVHDLVDFVSEESVRMAKKVIRHLNGEKDGETVKVCVNEKLKYAVPSAFFPGRDTVFAFRPLVVTNNGTLTAEQDGKVIWKKKIPFVRPAEMICFELKGDLINGKGDLTFRLEEGEKA